MPGAAEDAAGDFERLEALVGREPLHRRDRVPAFLLRTQGWLTRRLPNDRRQAPAIVIVLLALLVATTLAGARVLLEVAQELDLVAYLGLFLVNWLGNGGGLVPIPGARAIGLLMIFQQAVLLSPVEVWATGGVAMALGLLSYYVAGARSAAIYARGDREGAMEAAREAVPSAAVSTRRKIADRFSRSWAEARQHAQPVIERHGLIGMFALCLIPWPLSTAAAFLGGGMGFGFARFLLASFAAKLALSAIVVAAGILFSGLARGLIVA